MKSDMHLYHFSEAEAAGRPYDMEEPNFFGLMTLTNLNWWRRMPLQPAAGTAAAVSAAARVLCWVICPALPTGSRKYRRTTCWIMIFIFAVRLYG